MFLIPQLKKNYNLVQQENGWYKVKATTELGKVTGYISENEVDETLPNCFIYSGIDDSNLNKYINLSKHINVFDKKSINQIGSTIGTHVGSGTVGVVYFKK